MGVRWPYASTMIGSNIDDDARPVRKDANSVLRDAKAPSMRRFSPSVSNINSSDIVLPFRFGFLFIPCNPSRSRLYRYLRPPKFHGTHLVHPVKIRSAAFYYPASRQLYWRP